MNTYTLKQKGTLSKFVIQVINMLDPYFIKQSWVKYEDLIRRTFRIRKDGGLCNNSFKFSVNEKRKRQLRKNITVVKFVDIRNTTC